MLVRGVDASWEVSIGLGGLGQGGLYRVMYEGRSWGGEKLCGVGGIVVYAVEGRHVCICIFMVVLGIW